MEIHNDGYETQAAGLCFFLYMERGGKVAGLIRFFVHGARLTHRLE